MKRDRVRSPGSRRLLVAASVVVVALLASLPLLMRSRAFGPGRWKGFNVLLITIDTLRADRLGCYGFAEIRTPRIDSLAEDGALFERCVSSTPLTLPSHTTIFSGTYPLRHGVRDNGGFVVPAELPMLAPLFLDRRYRTAAVVGAFVLDSRWGLGRGFEEYHDDFDVHKEDIVSFGDIQRPANEVADAALRWLEGQSRKSPFFLWVQFFDPLEPYEPPSPFREQYPGRPYVGEIAFVDSQVGRLLDALSRRGLRDRTVVVLAGDHGESLGEHEEQGHGFLAYQTTLRVPLILSLPGSVPRGARRPEPVSLADIMPTIAEATALPVPSSVQGRSLLPLLAGGAGWGEVPVYAETYYPRLHFGWGELRSIQGRRYKIIESSAPELYDLEHDPTEEVNLARIHRPLYEEQRRRFAAFVDRWSQNPLAAHYRQDDPETVAKLASLGYIGARSGAELGSAATLAAPREKIGIFNRLNEARERTSASDFPGAERILKGILKADAGVIDAWSALGNLYLRQGLFAAAVGPLSEAVERKPTDATMVLSLATALIGDGKSGDADRTLRRS
ncbi:MAG: sulfatase-like hydrolase/transferase, partial [Thermoanaerobaculia bacterium]